MIIPSQTITLFDFAKPESARDWWVVNDGVMGGISESSIVLEEGRALFSGTLSLENNGGFASVRTRLRGQDLVGSNGFLLRVRGDGRSYKLRVRTHRSYDGIAYSADFTTDAGAWQTVQIATDRFRPTFRGRTVVGAPPLTMAEVRQLGFMVSDKQEGAFQLEIDWIKAYTL